MTERRRTYRVAERIRELIAQEVLELTDPRLQLVTITSVIISPDLRHAKVYWMVSGEDDRRGEVAEAFSSAEHNLRKLLARELGTRFVPDLKFFYDDTFDTAHKVEELLDRVARSTAEQNGTGNAAANPDPQPAPTPPKKS